MRQSIVVAGAAALAIGLANPLTAQRPASGPSVLSVEDLTSIRSVVGGAPPQWSPDGTRLMFAGAFGGSDLWAVAATGGFPSPLGVRMQASFFFPPPGPTYSPDGKWIAYVSNRTGYGELYLHSLDDGHEVQLTRMGARINSYSWSPDGHTIAFAGDRYGNYDIYRVAAPGGTITRLTTDRLNDVFPTWTPDGKRVLYVQLDDPWLQHTVFVIDADGNGTPSKILQDSTFFDYDEGATFGYPQVSPTGSTVLFRSHRSGWINYWVAPMSGGAPRPVAQEAADQSGAHWSPDGKSILYLALWNGMQDLRVVGATGGSPRVLVKPDDMGVVANAAWSPDGSRVSYTLATPVAPADLYVVPVAGGTARRLTNSAGPAYVEASLIRPKKVSYPTPDGLTIHAYLYEPILAAGAKAPGILLIHGGPTAQFSDTYQEQAEYFAMRGYAVLLPNIRGSSGYGRAFHDANIRCWGHCDLADAVAGVAYLRQQPYVEATRMGMTGASYGGYMSAAAAAFAPGVFQAIIPQSGYTDRVRFYNVQELRHIKQITYKIGALADVPDLYRYISPISAIDSIRTPLFLIDGDGKPGLPHSDDLRVFAERLEMRYKPYKYKTYPNEWYYVRDPANIRVMLGDMLAFFDQYLKDASGPLLRAASESR